MKIKTGMEQDYQNYKDLNSEDPYSKAIVTYSERWAELMEAGMSLGQVLTEIAEKTSHEADVEGITGFMYGCAVQGLAKFWEHGEELGTWHNESYGVKNSKGIVNPALLTLDLSKVE